MSVSTHNPTNNSAAVTCASNYHGFCCSSISRILPCDCHIDVTLEITVAF